MSFFLPSSKSSKDDQLLLNNCSRVILKLIDEGGEGTLACGRGVGGVPIPTTGEKA
jgi:hypothetical protein